MSTWDGFFAALEKIHNTERIPIIREPLLIQAVPVIQLPAAVPPEPPVLAVAADVA